MPKQEGFENRYRSTWEAFEAALADLEAGRGDVDAIGFPGQYRKLCHHLALARERQFAPRLVDELNALVQRGHNQLYRAAPRPWGKIRGFFARDFPRAVRSEWRVVLLAAALFFVPGVGLMWLVDHNPAVAGQVLGEQQVREFEGMYAPDNARVGRPRDADIDTMMFGFYIRNNIGVAFRSFASGIFFGVGSAFFLTYNGIFIGTAAGHINQVGYFETFYPFVIGHGSFELIAIVLAGAAGMRMGFALVCPGRRSRKRALQEAAHSGVRIVYGAAAMLVVAALIEAFWSPNGAIPNSVKYAVGSLGWLLVLAYFLFVGARDED